MYESADLCCCGAFCSLEMSMKFKMARETNKAASQRDRIQDLQNELIKGFFFHQRITNSIIHLSVYVVFLLMYFTVLCRRMTARRSF